MLFIILILIFKTFLFDKFFLINGFLFLDNLYNNQLESLPADIFKGLGSLQQIGLGMNRLRSFSGNLVRGLVALEFLHLDYNRIENVTDGLFEVLNDLCMIQVSFEDNLCTAEFDLGNDCLRITNSTC